MSATTARRQLDTIEHAGYRAEILAYGTEDPTTELELLRRTVAGLDAELEGVTKERDDMNWHMIREHDCKHEHI